MSRSSVKQQQRKLPLSNRSSNNPVETASHPNDPGINTSPDTDNTTASSTTSTAASSTIASSTANTDSTASTTPSSTTPSDTAEEVRPLRVLRRGLKISPELRQGIGVTVAMAVFAAAGRLIVPVLIQLVLDYGLISPEGYRPRAVAALALSAFGVVVIVAAASRAVHIRLVSIAESALLGLRVRVFDRIHSLSLASITRERRGVLVARVTSDVEALGMFMQKGAISLGGQPDYRGGSTGGDGFLQLAAHSAGGGSPSAVASVFSAGCNADSSQPMPECATGSPTRWAVPAKRSREQL